MIPYMEPDVTSRDYHGLTPDARAELTRVRAIFQRVDYSRDGYTWEIGVDHASDNGRVFIQLMHWRPDAVTGEWGWGKGGKRYLSPHMTVSEIVRVALSAALAYEEHEVREFFFYKHVRVFGPHIDVEALVDVAEKLDVR